MNFDGNAVDFRIGVYDAADRLEIGAGTTMGTTPGITMASSGGTGLPANKNYHLGSDGAAVPGPGITGGTGTQCKSWVIRNGDIVHTQILIDLTGLASTADGDIIGTGSADASIGTLMVAVNNTIFAGRMTCMEAPTTGEPDIDLYFASVSTGEHDDAVSGISGQARALDTAADWTVGTVKMIPQSSLPSGTKFLYLVASGGGTAGVYDHGMLLIEFWGA